MQTCMLPHPRQVQDQKGVSFIDLKTTLRIQRHVQRQSSESAAHASCLHTIDALKLPFVPGAKIAAPQAIHTALMK